MSKNDRYEQVRLSKIAHMRRINIVMQRMDEGAGLSASMARIRPQVRVRSSVGSHGHVCVRQVEFLSTVEADPVGAVVNREHTAEVTVPAAKDKLENPQQRFHQSCARWRRSQLPLASSHSSSERTLARARAIAQSAAP